MQTKIFRGVQTSVVRVNGETHGIYRGTTVARLNPDGSVILHSGGWLTYTTKARMNQFSREFCGERFRVVRQDGKWLVVLGPQTVREFCDGMTI